MATHTRPRPRTRTRHRSRHAFAAVLLGASLALAGCGSGSDSGATAQADSAPQEARAEQQGPNSGYAPDASVGKPADAASGAGQKKPAVRRQHIIRTAELSVEVKDADKALAQVRDLATGAGGHIADESTERHRKGRMTSRIVLRVPQSEYDRVLKDLTGTGKLLSRKAGAEDVTEQVVDVESRIATQRASVDRVRKLMEQATRLDDVVTLERELSSRQADLESLLAQQASLKDRTSLATITLHMTEPTAPEEQKKDEDPSFLDALSGGWNALVTSVTWFVVVLAALAPWLAVLAVLYLVWRRILRPWRERRLAAKFRPPVEAPARTPVPAQPQARTPAQAQAQPQQAQHQAQPQPQPEAAASGPDTGSGE